MSVNGRRRFKDMTRLTMGRRTGSAKATWGSFLKSIASFNGDLASMTAPPFILSKTSLVEYSAYWTEHPRIFVAPAKESDPEKRALLVLKWFLSTLKQQYSSRSEKLGSEKKPLNPFLGELFLGHWDDEEAGRTELISEQVSHHPPVTAYSIVNEKHGVKLQGYNGQKAGFASMMINVKQVGIARLRLEKWDEEYLITLPALHIEGLVYGTPYVELEKNTVIQSSSGYIANIEYTGKGWVSGKKNCVKATLMKNGGKEPLYVLEGQWTDSFTVKQGKTEVDKFVHKENPTTPLTIKPIDEQDPLESRRAWAKVAAAIDKGNLEETSVEKSKIENAQRDLRKQEKAEGKTWHRRYFSILEPGVRKPEDRVAGEEEDDDEGEMVVADARGTKIHELVEMAGGMIVMDDPAKTNGVWVFDEAKYKDLKEGKKDGEVRAAVEKVVEATEHATGTAGQGEKLVDQ